MLNENIVSLTGTRNSMALKATEEIKKKLIKIKEKKGISLVIDRNSLITSFFHYGK